MIQSHETPDPLQGHPSREWPSTPYSDEARAEEPPLETACCIVLLGGCTVSASNWPPAMRSETQLAVRLRRSLPGQPFVVRNLAEAGETAGDFVASGRLSQLSKSLPHVDVAFLRYGIADRKKDGVQGCIENIRRLCELLERQYPGITLILETDMWVDYPAHYLWDRNTRLAPLFDALRAFGSTRGYPIVDIFQLVEAETKRGNWDLRVRGLPDPEHTILDDSFDPFFADDPAFFTNIHPNSKCLGLIADWEVAHLKRVLGDRLPNYHYGRSDR